MHDMKRLVMEYSYVDMVLKKANSRLYALRLLKKAGLQASHIVQIYISFIIDPELNMHPLCGRQYLNHYLTFSNLFKREH